MEQTQASKSYATFGLLRSLHQLRYAWRERSQADTNMSAVLADLRVHEARMEHKLGERLENLRILEIGPGQGLERARYFGIRNEVLGLDLDIIPQGLDPAGYLRMYRENGAGRLLKTLGRKLILGGPNNAAWQRAVGSKKMKSPRIIHGDICQSHPAREEFDIVMSWSVFEHLPDPAAALGNVITALKPGGIFYISLHLYTSNNGHHDIRAFTGREELLPVWGHLRPSTQDLIERSSYLNEWRLPQWRALFSEQAPGAEEFLISHDHRDRFGPSLTTSMRQELDDYTDEELFTVDVIYLWQKSA